MATTPTESRTTDEDLAAKASRREPGGQASRGAEDAFANLYERHARPLLAFLIARTRRDAAEDLAQEVWKRVWHHLPGGFRGGNFRAWLFEIARHAMIDNARRRNPEPLGEGEAILIDGRHGSPEDGLVERERAERLLHCLEELPAEAAALVRARLGGDDYDAVCARFGITENRAYKLFHKAKGQLQECLERATG